MIIIQIGPISIHNKEDELQTFYPSWPVECDVAECDVSVQLYMYTRMYDWATFNCTDENNKDVHAIEHR